MFIHLLFCLPVDKCQYWLDLENGQLTSPKHPNNYGNNELCSWTISVTDSYIIILDFHYFDVNIYIDVLYVCFPI